MPYVKISPQVKRQALDKIKTGMGLPDAAKMFGISPKTLKLWAEKDSNSSLASTPSPSSKPTPLEGQDTQGEEKTTLDFQESPAPVEKKGVVDSALSSLKGMLGMGDDKKKAAPLVSAKLDPKRQQFVDAATPTLSLAAMALAAWMWGRIGPEYSVLAPDEKVAQRIVEPLLRVYVRHASFMTDINPDIADVGASMFALVGYVHVSLGIYQQIKREKEEADEQGYSQESNVSNINRRSYRTTPGEPEGRAGNAGRGYAPVQRASRADAQLNGSDGRDSGGVNRPNLSDKEAFQHARLSRLSQLDYQHRARRAGLA